VEIAGLKSIHRQKIPEKSKNFLKVFLNGRRELMIGKVSIKHLQMNG